MTSAPPDAGRRAERAWPVRRVLFLSTSLLVLAIAGAGIVLSAIERRRVVRDLSQVVISQTQQEVAARLRALFDPIQQRLQIDWMAARLGMIRPYRSEDLVHRFFPPLYHLPAVGSMMVGDTTGYQFLLMRYDSTVIRSPLLSARTDLPPPANRPQYFTRDFRPATRGDLSAWALWDPDGRRVVHEWEERLPGYDPTGRAWYLQAVGRLASLRASGDTTDAATAVAWTDAYTLFTTRSTGMSASMATTGPDGQVVIVAYDLLLEDLARFTRERRPTPRGHVFVLTDDGRVVGAPAADADRPENAPQLLAPVDSAGTPVLTRWAEAWRNRTGDGADTRIFVAAGERWWGGHRPFIIGGGRRFWIGVAIPEADLLEGGRWFSLLIVGAALLTLAAALAAAAVLARSISAPLAAVAGQSERIQALDLSPGRPVRTRIREIARLSDAVGAMRRSLADWMARHADAMADLAESESRFRATFEHASVGITHLGPDGHYLRVNRRFAEIVGRAPEDLLGRAAQDLIHPEDHAADRERLRAVAEAPEGDRRGPQQWEVRYVRPDGTVTWAQKTGAVLRGPDGTLRYFITAVQDISERKSLEEQFRQSQKLEAVGQLAGGVAHDFNNLLTAVLGYTSLVRGQLAPDAPAMADLDQIEASAHRASDLTRQLLAFARRQRVEPRVVQLNDLVERTERLLQRLLEARITVDTRLAGDLPAVRVDPGHLEQVLVNLAVNARDAMPDGGVLTITTSAVHLPAAREGPDPLDAGDYVALTVRDTGEGIEPAVIGRVFEPFFTTKEPGRGTGLGLATCWGIVRQAGGRIDVESTPGQGSTFRVLLPAVFQAPTPAPAPAAPGSASRRGSATILVADDEAQIREVVSRALTRRGYRVLVGHDGDSALAVARNEAGPIDLLLSDVVMPGLNGPGLAATLAAERPGLRVLLMSGYHQGLVASTGEFSHPFIQKPFPLDQLLDRIAALLDEGDEPPLSEAEPRPGDPS